jgi:hypothetical protein
MRRSQLSEDAALQPEEYLEAITRLAKRIAISKGWKISESDSSEPRLEYLLLFMERLADSSSVRRDDVPVNR